METFRVCAPLPRKIVHFYNPESGVRVAPGFRPLALEWEPMPSVCFPLVVVVPEMMAIEGYELADLYAQAVGLASLEDWYADLRRRYVPEND